MSALGFIINYKSNYMVKKSTRLFSALVNEWTISEKESVRYGLEFESLDE